MLNDADKQFIRDTVKAEVAAAVASNRLDIGTKFKWSDDAVAQKILTRLERIEAKIPGNSQP